jgi:hypothetical protein
MNQTPWCCYDWNPRKFLFKTIGSNISKMCPISYLPLKNCLLYHFHIITFCRIFLVVILIFLGSPLKKLESPGSFKPLQHSARWRRQYILYRRHGSMRQRCMGARNQVPDLCQSHVWEQSDPCPGKRSFLPMILGGWRFVEVRHKILLYIWNDSAIN